MDAPEPAPTRGLRPRPGPWVAAGAATALLALAVRVLPPQPGEGAAWRWLRMLAEHPVRGFVATGLVFWALAPAPRSPDRAGHGPREGL